MHIIQIEIREAIGQKCTVVDRDHVWFQRNAKRWMGAVYQFKRVQTRWLRKWGIEIFEE